MPFLPLWYGAVIGWHFLCVVTPFPATYNSSLSGSRDLSGDLGGNRRGMPGRTPSTCLDRSLLVSPPVYIHHCPEYRSNRHAPFSVSKPVRKPVRNPARLLHFLPLYQNSPHTNERAAVPSPLHTEQRLLHALATLLAMSVKNLWNSNFPVCLDV